MAVFTLVWAALAEIVLRGRDRWLLGVFFGAVLLLLLGYYRKFNAAARKLPADRPAGDDPGNAAEKKRNRRFLFIFIAEGVAILLIQNILANTGLDDYFIPCLALIVGLHFFPLAGLFKQTFYYYLGVWISLVAIAGIVLIYRNILPFYQITAGVATGCALATSVNGLRIVLRGGRQTQDDGIAIY